MIHTAAQHEVGGGAIADLDAVARRIRGHVVAMSHRSGAAHLGSALSCVDMLVAAYWRLLRVDPQRPDAPDRDRLILSKGHAASALYAALAIRGYFNVNELRRFGQAGLRLPEQPSPGCLPGIEWATGSLGHGLPVGVGMALAGRVQQRDYRTLVIISDGECNEGAVWEAAMFAAGQQLGRLAVVVDFNRWQATGRSTEILALEPLAEKFAAFGWRTAEVDGHDIEAIAAALRERGECRGRPLALIAHAIKGKGASFMEDDNNWHYRVPTAGEVVAAHDELGLTPPEDIVIAASETTTEAGHA
jgi:transketolase